ncbi:hypothetical protein [Sorangium sp. So ce1153]
MQPGLRPVPSLAVGYGHAAPGQQLARDGYPYVTIRLVSDAATWVVI